MMNIYGDAVTPEMREAHGKIVSLALNSMEKALIFWRWWAL